MGREAQQIGKPKGREKGSGGGREA
jgi:hypothetical protein